MSAASAGDARIDFLLSTQQKELIEAAAAQGGQSLREFAAQTLLEKAQQVLQQGTVRTLSHRDALRFVELLDVDSGPNEALRQAAQRYRRDHG